MSILEDIEYELNVCSIDNQDSYFFSMYDMFIILNTLGAGLCLGLTVVSIFVFKPYYEKCITEEFNCKYPELPYEYKYALKNKSRVGKCQNGDKDNKDELHKLNNNSFICENTPDGNVIMRYDSDEEGFIYWCDKIVTFYYLDTVARKFVNSFDCPDYYILNNIYDIDADENEHDNGDKKSEDKEKDNEEDDKNDEVSVFFTSSSINKVNNQKTPQVKRNKFIRRGKFNEFNFLQQYTDTDKDKKQKMTFDIFKEMFYKK